MGFNPFESIDRALDKGSNALHRAASKVRNDFNDTTRGVRRTSSSALNTARREIDETRQGANRTVRNTVSTARREIDETKQGASRTIRNTVNTARREIDETRQGASRTVGKAVNIARGEIGETRQVARNVVNTARYGIGETRQEVSRTATNAVNAARRDWNEATNPVRRTADNFASTARREWNETTQAVRNTSSSVVNNARREIGETSQAVWRTTNNFANTPRRHWNFVPEFDWGSEPEPSPGKGRPYAFFKHFKNHDIGLSGAELGIGAIGSWNPDGPQEVSMVSYSRKLGLIREEGNSRVGDNVRLDVFRYEGNVLDNLHDSGSVPESVLGNLEINFLSVRGENSVGNDGLAIGGGGSILDLAYTGGTINAESSYDSTVRIGIGLGAGVAGRLHWDDVDDDGYREYGLGIDVKFLSLDIKAEDPLIRTVLTQLAQRGGRAAPYPATIQLKPNT